MNQDSQTPSGPEKPDARRPGPRRPVNPGALGNAAPAPPMYPQVLPPPQRQRDSWALTALRRMLSGVLLFSILLNVFLIVRLGLLSAGPQEHVYSAGDKTQRIVILPIEGPIFDLTDQFVHDALDHLEVDPPKALLLRIDSPGGGVAASDRIAERLRRFHETTGVPIIASYGGEAASGAYYISAAADRIIAEPTCVTGSIGVIMPAFTIEQLLNKIGVTPRTVVAEGADHKDVGSITRAWTDEDRAVLQGIIDHMHTRFVQVVAKGRGLSLEEARGLADGAPLTVEQAMSRQLIDAEGYLPEAIAQAAEVAGIDPQVKPHVTMVRVREGLGGLSLLGLGQSGVSQGMVKRGAPWLHVPLQEAIGQAWFGRLPLLMRRP